MANQVRNYSIIVGSCNDLIQIGWDSTYVQATSDFRLDDGTLIPSSGCDAPFSILSYPDIPNDLASLSYTIPAGICGAGTGLVDFYLSGIVDVTGPCQDIIMTPPSATAIEVACPAVIDPAGPFCVSAPAVNLTATNMPGGTWSGTGITNATLGTFNPAVAGIGSHIITYDVGCPMPSTITIVVTAGPVIDPTFISPSQTSCSGDSSGNIVNGAMISGGTFPYSYDWDYQGTPGNDVYPDDGNTSRTWTC